MAANHTPGPWKANGTKIVYQFDKGFTETIADVRGGSFGDHNDTSHSNARLIAAAPELLGALIYLVNAHEHPAASSRSRTGVLDHVPPALKRARTIIETVLGEDAFPPV